MKERSVSHSKKPNRNGFRLQPLPPAVELESRAILRQLSLAHRYLAELKGMATTIPNESILINTLTLQEAKDSSEVENIITTHDELYRDSLFRDYARNPAAKEVNDYATALRVGFEKIREDGLITVNRLLEIHRVLEQNDAGLRKLPGTELKNERTGEIVYTPPQDYETIITLMSNLERFINDSEMLDADPLVKMAVIHYQFESIHPFYDGNGRTGRILNILYLVAQRLLDIPILYLSRYIIRTKDAYYRKLQAVRDEEAWEAWIRHILEGVEQTAWETIGLIREIKLLMQEYKHRIRSEFPKIYSQDLLNNLFRHPYTKIEFVQRNLRISRITATKYLEQLSQAGFIEKHKMGRNNYYVNQRLFSLLSLMQKSDRAS
uniref:Protein adenylyltransferase n=1 Tax=Candidatus Kentrum sp. DK TaxID=2126562 RepID=A0A450SL08_9GAMM|nr:MAG: Fic family protein [Candidatus Kentron sp. DK]VFJ55829.1 MAG: Fic family protein [Candidatus Kentron sp. DK]